MADPVLPTANELSLARTLRGEVGRGLQWVGARYFDRVRFSPGDEALLRRLSAEGFVVHVMRTNAWINYLYLAWALVRRSLPPVRAVVNLTRFFGKPWRKAVMRGPLDVRFTYARRNGGSGLVFLKETALANPRAKASKEDPFPALVELARKSDRPVYLVPELFVWERRQQRIAPSAFDFVWGSPEAPGLLHSFFAFWRHHASAQFRVGEPVNLTEVVASLAGEDTARIARKVRGALHHHLAAQTRAVFGPPAKSPDRIIEEVLRDRTLRVVVEEVAQETGRAVPKVTRYAEKAVRSIAARPNATALGITAHVLKLIFNRIYSGLDVDEEGLERAMMAGARAPLVLTPSHKSHIDYLVLSTILWHRGYNTPLIAAGANLSFFPLGPYLRRISAFFMRRSFKGDRVYASAFKAYIRRLVHDGILQEFFLEGGRSRTGKLLPPKLGMLTWQVEAVLDGARDDLNFVPIAIDYERIVESSSYSKELAGGQKKAEDVRSLLSAPKVLTENYGRIHISFDAPISLKALLAERGLDPNKGLSEDDKRTLVRALGNRIMYGISKVAVITPQALLAAALLCHRRRGATERDIVDRITLIRRAGEGLALNFSSVLKDAPASPLTLGPIAEAMRTFATSEWVRIADARGDAVFQVDDGKRLDLLVYKNMLLNRLAGHSIVSTAILASGHDASLAVVREHALFLSRLFKFEFSYRADASFDTIFQETLLALSTLGLVERHAESSRVVPTAYARESLQFLSELTADFLESYRLMALRAAEGRPADRKDFTADALDLGRAEYLAGRVVRAEALSRVNLENALAFLLDAKVAHESDKKVTPDVTAAHDLILRLDTYLKPRPE